MPKPKSKRPSRNQLERELRKANSNLAHYKDRVELEQRLRMEARTVAHNLRNELQDARKTLKEAFQPVMRHWDVRFIPSFNDASALSFPTWDIRGECFEVAIRISASSFRMIPYASKEAYLAGLACQFGDMARDHALKSIRILE